MKLPERGRPTAWTQIIHKPPPAAYAEALGGIPTPLQEPSSHLPTEIWP
jgi:hypothetical protein